MIVSDTYGENTIRWEEVKVRLVPSIYHDSERDSPIVSSWLFGFCSTGEKSHSYDSVRFRNPIQTYCRAFRRKLRELFTRRRESRRDFAPVVMN